MRRIDFDAFQIRIGHRVAAFDFANHQQPDVRTILENNVAGTDHVGNALMLLNQPCCAGLAVKMQHEDTAALRPTCDELVQQLLVQTQLAMDESPTKKGSAKAWQNRSNELQRCKSAEMYRDRADTRRKEVRVRVRSVVNADRKLQIRTDPNARRPSQPLRPRVEDHHSVVTSVPHIGKDPAGLIPDAR